MFDKKFIFEVVKMVVLEELMEILVANSAEWMVYHIFSQR